MTSFEVDFEVDFENRQSSVLVHGSPFSMDTLRVLAALTEKNIFFYFGHVDMAKPFITDNPFGQLPDFQDGGNPSNIRLYESRAITKYLAGGEFIYRGTPLIPAGPKEKAYVVVWMEVEAHQFDPLASRLAFEIGFKPMIGEMPDEEVVAECVGKLERVLDIYEGRLGETKYLGGDEFSLVDVHHQPTLHVIMETDGNVKELVESRPRVKAWCQDILARPAWAKVIELQNKYK